MKTDFVHLHLHTEYSLLDGFTRIDRLFQRVKELGMSSVAITDHGVMFGAVEFYKRAKSEGIKPIIGCEVYVGLEDGIRDTNHLVLLVKNEIGYKNLVKLVSLSHSKGFYYKPRIKKEWLTMYSEGLVALSACINGEVSKAILDNDFEKARSIASFYKGLFKDDYYLELQDHGLKDELFVNRILLKLSKELEIPVVATNDVHYLEREDYKAHDILLCIQTGKEINDEDRMRFPNDEFYLKSPQEMQSLFEKIPPAIENTLIIADKCNFEFDFSSLHLPKYEGEETLRDLCYTALSQKYSDKEYVLALKRLEHELSVISQMGYNDYFLIVYDLIRKARELEIAVGPGRGSVGGSICAYLLGITEVDPIKYNLIFERFLNPERITMPDIDMDFEDVRRQEIIDYVSEKYGKDRVCHIITFGTLAAKAAIRDVGRAMGVPGFLVDKLAKEIPQTLGITLENALNENPKIKVLTDSDEKLSSLFEMAKKLEGLPRHASTHAAGIIISSFPLDEMIPIFTNNTTQYSMGYLEELGMLKMDFLGLRNLSVIKNAVEMIKNNKNLDLDRHDDGVFEMLSKGESTGVFQLESVGFRRFLKKLKPRNLEEIIAGISLFRPGPMDSIPKFIESKENTAKVVYKHHKLKPILEETYGCIVYQEQVMRIVRELAGYSYASADILRRAMGKKKMDVMLREKERFIYGDESAAGCIKNGISERVASELFDEMTDFAKYAFNKSHAAGYAILAYRCAYLKKNYPLEFMASLLSNSMFSIKKYIEEARGMGITMLAPHINYSDFGFTVEDDGIRFGLLAIKNVGRGIIQSTISARVSGGHFKDLYDYVSRLSRQDINKKAIESLIYAGALDGLAKNRASLLANLQNVVEKVLSEKKTVNQNQLSFDGLSSLGSSYSHEVEEMPYEQKLELEKEMLSVYLSGNPLENYRKFMPKLTISELSEDTLIDGKVVVLGGMITSIKEQLTKKNEMMAFMQLEDFTDSIELIAFPQIYNKASIIGKINSKVLVKGRVQVSDQIKLVLMDIKPLGDSKVDSENLKIYLRFVDDDALLIKRADALIQRFNTMSGSNSKPYDVIYYLPVANKKKVKEKRLFLSKIEIMELIDLLGENNVAVKS